MTGWTIGLIMVLPMSAVNAFTEEVVFRLSYVTSTENAGLSPTWAMALGSLVFGFVHYWGIAPKWTIGAVLVAYIGFFLTKSSLETKGFLFAWAVHAILDVVIHTPDHRYRHNPEFLQELIFIRKSEISLAENLSNCKHHLVDLLLKPRWAIPCIQAGKSVNLLSDFPSRGHRGIAPQGSQANPALSFTTPSPILRFVRCLC
jgi:hypothetical protein